MLTARLRDARFFWDEDLKTGFEVWSKKLEGVTFHAKLGTLAERVEVRRLLAWFDEKFDAEVTRNLAGEKFMKRMSGRGHPDAALLRAGYANIKSHLDYLGWLAEHRRYLAGASISLADFCAAAHLSVLDFTGDVDWQRAPAVREWYARMKSRPSFRPLLTERVSGMTPPDHYANLDF